jgi:hypothetical protein
MRKALGLVLAAAALAGCSLERPEPDIAPVPALRSISVEMSSWGKPITSWTIGRDGEGRYAFSRGLAVGSFHDYDLVTKRFTISTADFAKVEALLAGARAYAGGEIPCSPQISDQIYGRIGWSEGGEPLGVEFDFGCVSPTAETIYRQLNDAHALVKALGEAGDTVQESEVREPRG